MRRNNREYNHHPGYIIFLMLVMVFMVAVSIQYLMLRLEVTTLVKDIARLETQLNELREQNDETENRIMSSVDLEEIKYRAIHELGMRNVNHEQIITFEPDDPNYVTQVEDIE